jgi:hypothetical protein
VRVKVGLSWDVKASRVVTAAQPRMYRKRPLNGRRARLSHIKKARRDLNAKSRLRATRVALDTTSMPKPEPKLVRWVRRRGLDAETVAFSGHRQKLVTDVPHFLSSFGLC